MRLLLVQAAVAVSLLCPLTPGQELKLHASDGALDDRFGVSVSIGGTTSIVGAHWHDDNGDNSGSAYLFDVSTGAQTAKLLSTHGALQRPKPPPQGGEE